MKKIYIISLTLIIFLLGINVNAEQKKCNTTDQNGYLKCCYKASDNNNVQIQLTISKTNVNTLNIGSKSIKSYSGRSSDFGSDGCLKELEGFVLNKSDYYVTSGYKNSNYNNAYNSSKNPNVTLKKITYSLSNFSKDKRGVTTTNIVDDKSSTNNSSSSNNSKNANSSGNNVCKYTIDGKEINISSTGTISKNDANLPSIINKLTTSSFSNGNCPNLYGYQIKEGSKITYYLYTNETTYNNDYRSKGTELSNASGSNKPIISSINSKIVNLSGSTNNSTNNQNPDYTNYDYVTPQYGDSGYIDPDYHYQNNNNNSSIISNIGNVLNNVTSQVSSAISNNTNINDSFTHVSDPNGYTALPSSGVVSCGNPNGLGIKGMPVRIVKIINTIIKILYIGAPIILIILGMIDLGKAVVSQKEDEISKGRRVFIKRLISGLLIFLVIIIVKWGAKLINDSSESSNIISCIDCFMNGSCN